MGNLSKEISEPTAMLRAMATGMSASTDVDMSRDRRAAMNNTTTSASSRPR